MITPANAEPACSVHGMVQGTAQMVIDGWTDGLMGFYYFGVQAEDLES